MKILNACRMYYQVAHVSDVTTPDGSRLRANISSGEMSREQLNTVYQPQHECPEQEHPDKKAWNLWEKALCLTVCSNSGKLYTPLGRWKQELDNTWKYYFSTTDNYLYAWTDKGWTRHSPIRLGMTQKYEKNGQASEKPYRPYPATPKIGTNAYTCHHSYSSSTNIETTQGMTAIELQ
eukprot:scaffold91518_cov33-Attheya_sp.AAC.4